VKVIKIGGGCLNGSSNIARIVDLIVQRAKGQVIVVSALSGVTDFLIEGLKSALDDEETIPKLMNKLKIKHMNVARKMITSKSDLDEFNMHLNKAIFKLERLYYGLNFTRENTPRLQDVITSYGERISAQLLTSIMRSRKVPAVCRMPDKIGIISDGKYGDATADLKETTVNLKKAMRSIRNKYTILFIPGFFGVSPAGDITTFGRGGSDYSAAVVAAALGADCLEIWKDVDGFMSADPKLVPDAQLIPILSYEEAAELAYFGAKILHPRSIEPVRGKKLDILVKNTLNPDADGSLITVRSPQLKSIIKSVSYDTNVAVLKVHAAGVGARPGVLSQVAGQLANNNINIRSVITSQTCISLILSKEDLEPGRDAVQNLRPRPYRRIEVLDDIALIAIVGEGILRKKGVAARCFTAVAGCNVNVEMISFGPSRAALYFLTKLKDLSASLNAIHSTFFSSPQCTP
jgi:aspartate kinase